MIGQTTIKSAEVDSRTQCGLKDCKERAISLFAWPLSLPVPLCPECRQAVIAAVNRIVADESVVTPEDWLTWLQAHAKPSILAREKV